MKRSALIIWDLRGLVGIIALFAAMMLTVVDGVFGRLERTPTTDYVHSWCFSMDPQSPTQDDPMWPLFRALFWLMGLLLVLAAVCEYALYLLDRKKKL